MKRFGGRHGPYRLATAALLLVLVGLRLFQQEPVTILNDDEPKYLAVAHDFPRHRLYNRSFWVLHGPGYPALVRLGMIVWPDYLAGITVSVAMAVAAFGAIGWLARAARLNRTGVFLARAFLVFLPLHIDFSQYVFKESTLVALYAILLGGYVLYLSGRRRLGWAVAAAGGYFSLTADQHAFQVLGSLGPVWLLWPGRRSWRHLWPLAPLVVLWIGMMGARWIAYQQAPLVAVGIDGIPDESSRLGLLAAFNPNLAPQTHTYFGRTHIAQNLANAKQFLWNFFLPFRQTPHYFPTLYLVHRLLMLAVVAGLGYALLARGRRRRHRVALALAGAAGIIMAVPLAGWPQARLALMAAVPLAVLAGMNGWGFPRRWRWSAAAWALAPAALGLGILVAWARGGVHWVYACPAVVQAEPVAAWLRARPTRAILAQVGYPPELAYLTDRRVIGLPPDPRLLEPAIRQFDVSHIVLGSFYYERWDWPDRSRVWCAATIDHLLAHPERFRPVARLKQPAVGRQREDEFLILEVVEPP